MLNVQASEFRPESSEKMDLTSSPFFQPISKTRLPYTYNFSEDQLAYNAFQTTNASAETMDPWCVSGAGCGLPPLYNPTPMPSPGSFMTQPPPDPAESSGYLPRTDISPAYVSNKESSYVVQGPAGIWSESDPVDNYYNGMVIATDQGTLTIRMHSRMRVDMTIDRAIRITNLTSNVAMAVSATGANSALIHPNGRIHQYGSRVEIQAHDPKGNDKYAKMFYNGVSFTSDVCALVYLVDNIGTRTTADEFSDLNRDFSMSVFYDDSRHGADYQQDALRLLKSAQYFVDDKQAQNWIINNVRISQTPDGLVRVARNSNKYQLRSSPGGSATISTPFVHATASLGQKSHLFVRRGERRMHYDGSSFMVRNASHSAGIEENNMLRVL